MKLSTRPDLSGKIICKFISFVLILLCCSNIFAKTIHFALNWKAEPQFGGILAAQNSGIFAKDQLDVDVTEGGSGTPTLQMLATRQIDYGVVSADELVIAAARGHHDLVAVFASFQKNPQGIMVRSSEKINSIKEIFESSRTLLWQEGLPYAQYLKKKYAGSFKIKTAPYPGGISSFLLQKDVVQQCFATSEPLLAKAEGVESHVFLAADEGYNPYTGVVAVRREYWEKNKPEVIKMVGNLREGWIQYLKNPGMTHTLIVKMNPSMNESLLKTMDEAQRPFIETAKEITKGTGKDTELGNMRSSRWVELAGDLYDTHVISAKIETSQLFVNP